MEGETHTAGVQEGRGIGRSIMALGLAPAHPDLEAPQSSVTLILTKDS